MNSWKRITLVIFVLIGGTVYFSYWSTNQFDSALDNLSAVYLADTPQAYSSFKQKLESAPTLQETSMELATSTGSTDSPQANSGQATSTDPELSFTFPQKNTDVYIGCTYPISWQSSTTIGSLEAALIDAGAREPVGPKTSGLAKENTIEKESQNLNWKVGFVWPGEYYIKISKINGVDTEIRSKVFIINKMPENIGASEQKDICEKSSGSF